MADPQQEKPLLLVIDDSKTFLDMIKTFELESTFRVVSLHYQQGYKLDNIIQKIRDNQPEHLLLDVNLIEPTQSQTLLKEASKANAIPRNCAIWIISQEVGNKPEDTIRRYRRINMQVKEKLFTKPISARTLQVALLDQSIYEARPPFDDSFPLPFRVLSKMGDVKFSNRGWEVDEYKPPPEEFDSWFGAQATIPAEEKYVGSFPGIDGIHAGYRVISFPLEQEGEKFLGQIVVTEPLPNPTESLNETLDLIFSTMNKAGFPRGRYYRFTPLAGHEKVSEYDTLVELYSTNPEIQSQITLPYRFPLTGVLKERFGKALKEQVQEKLGSELIRFLRLFHEDEETKDSRITELNKILEISAETTPSWLEIPIYIKDYDSLGLGEFHGHRMAGLLIFDQYGPDSPNAIDQEVAEGRINSIKHVLLSLVYRLNLVLKREQDQRLRDYEYSMRQLDKKLANRGLDNDGRNQLVLEALMEHCRADSAILMVKEDSVLYCTASQGDGLPPFFKGLRFPINSMNYLLTKSFKKTRKIVVQDYPTELYQQRIKQDLNGDNELSLNEEHKTEFYDWLGKIQSAAAIPVITDDPDRPIGAIVLQYYKKWGVNTRRMSSANAILHRVRWVMMDTIRKEEHRSWEKIIGHDLSTSLTIIEQYSQLLAKKHPDVINSNHWREVQFYLQDAIDQAKNLQKIWSEEMVQSYEVFKPRSIVEDYMNLSEGYRKDYAIQYYPEPVWQDPVWQTSICLNKELYSRILRNLLQNSSKHGRKFVDMTKGENYPCQVVIKAKRQGRQWMLSIINPGHMDKEEYEARFAERPRFRAMKDGAHIGLAAVKFWTDKMECGLTLENLGASEVQAVLTCPIKEENHNV